MNATNTTVDIEASPPVFVLYVFGVCVVAGVVRLTVRFTVVHHTVVMFYVGALFGYIALTYPAFHKYVNIDFLITARLLQVHTLLLPVVILEYLFSMDPRVFLSCSPIAVLTVVLDYVLTLLSQGAFTFFFLSFYEYDVPKMGVKTTLIYLLVGSLTSVTDTSYVVNTFYKMGSYWVLVKLMEIKRVISLVGACFVYILVVYAHELDFNIEVYHVFYFLLLQFLACPILGWITAQFVILWLGRLYNDINVEITVSIAVAFLLYYFGTVYLVAKPMVSAISVVVYALLLNNRRTCFSLGLDTFLHKLVGILAYIVKTVIFTIVGFLIAHEDFSKSKYDIVTLLTSILISITMYAWCMLARCIVCALAAPMLRQCGYKLSWQELSTMVLCNVTGTVCLITAVASCNKNLVSLFFDQRDIQYMLMFHLTVVALLRSLIAGTCFRRVLIVFGMRRVSLGRYVAMNNALQKIQDQVGTAARSYKFDRFLADADWETVHNFSNFDNPYQSISRYSVIGEAMNLDLELLGDIRLNLLHAQKMSFWRQYEQGLLSLRALRILLEECYLAEWKVTTNSYDIGDQIRKHYETKDKGMFNLIQTVKQKFEQQQEIRRLIIEEIENAVRGKWKKSVFKFGLHMTFEVVLIIAVAVSAGVSIAVLVYESSCVWPSWVVHILSYLDHAFMIYFTIYLILKLYIFKWRYLVLFGSIFNIGLLILGWSDIGLHATVLMSPLKTCDELKRTQWDMTAPIVVHKLFVACQLLRLFIILEDKTYIIAHTMKKRMLLQLQLGYDVGKAYVYCKEDVSQTAREFIAQSAILEDVQKQLQGSRVQLMRELATVQKQNPGIVVSVKSQEACRRLLNVAKETVNQLQRNGRVDAYEADMLDEMIKLRLKRLNQIPAQIEIPSVDVLISKLPWVNGDETLMRFLHFNSRLFNMAEGESADFDADPSAGLYILVSGLIRVNWRIGEPYGKLDHLHHTSSETSTHSLHRMVLHDYMSTGSTFGELALLTETPFAIDAVCETTVLIFHVQRESIQTGLDWIVEPSLEEKLWLLVAVRLSIPLLKALPGYYSASLEYLKLLADHGTLTVRRLDSPFYDGINEQSVSLARYMSSHVILIHGTANKSGETIVGPVIIPPDNDDLVFTSVLCDVFVLYIVPQRIHAGTNARDFTYSASASEISTAMDVSKENSGFPRAGKRRGRKLSVSGGGLRLTERSALQSPAPSARFEQTIAETESSAVTGSTSEEEKVEDIVEAPDTHQITKSPVTRSPRTVVGIPDAHQIGLTKSPVLFSPQTSKPDSTIVSSESYSLQAIKSVEKTEPTKEEVIEVGLLASQPKQMEISQQTTQEKREETRPEKVIETRDESIQTEVFPRRSSSEIIISHRPLTEAWKYVLPKIKPSVTIGKSPQKSPAQHTSTTPAAIATAAGRSVADRTAGPAAGQESAGTAPAESTVTSAPVPVTSAQAPMTSQHSSGANASAATTQSTSRQ